MRGVTEIKRLGLTFKTISTHTPHARRDERVVDIAARLKRFLLTRLMRGVTVYIYVRECGYQISTHTPHARRDQDLTRECEFSLSISTHTPHARRDKR